MCIRWYINKHIFILKSRRGFVQLTLKILLCLSYAQFHPPPCYAVRGLFLQTFSKFILSKFSTRNIPAHRLALRYNNIIFNSTHITSGKFNNDSDVSIFGSLESLVVLSLFDVRSSNFPQHLDGVNNAHVGVSEVVQCAKRESGQSPDKSLSNVWYYGTTTK